MNTLAPLKRLFPYIRPQLKLIFASAFLAIPLAALRFSPVPLVKHIVDDLLVSRDAHKLYYFPILFVGIFVLNFVIRFLHYYMLRIVVARVNQQIKNDLFEHLMGLSADYFSSQKTGALISRVGNDPQYIDGGLSTLNVLFREPITFLFLFGYVFWLNWKLTVITVFILPPLAWVFSATGRNLKRYISRMTEHNAQLFATLQEGLSGIRVIQAFQLEKYIKGQFHKSTDAFRHFLLKTAVLEESAHPMIELLTAFAIAAVIYVGGSQVLSGQMTSGDLLAFFAAFAMMMNPLRNMNDVNIKMYAAAAAAARIFEVFDWKSNIAEPAQPRGFSGFKDKIEFDRVRFAYPDNLGKEVIAGISFSLPKNSVIALVGASGGGKSSLVNLLPRIFDVTGGVIRIDGVDIRELSLAELRRQIAVVSQDVFLFNDSVEANIRCGRFDATDAEVREAADRAHALAFIDRLPEGMKTVIGDRGQKLSGGERQRLSIARAFLRQAAILILDEETSNLDTASEAAIQESLFELMKDRTTLMIAHRLSTVKNADEILVLKQGQIIERGRHADLISKSGEYTRLHQAMAVE